MKILKFLTIFAAVTLLFTACCKSNSERSAYPEPKNVVMIIGDGMGPAQVYSLIMTSDSPTAFERFQYSGFSVTKSANKPITDSAAGGSAIAVGQKSNNGNIGMSADSIPQPSMLDLLAARGKKTGVVVTCAVTHATPASFIAHNVSRSNNEEIAVDIANRNNLDVLMGGGKKYFCERKDGENLLDQMFDKGWNIYESLDAVQDKEGRTFVVADRKHLPEACKRGDFLPKATAKAIDLLDNEKGFFLMIEGSQIDFACHDNDSATMVDEMRDFNDMLNVVLDFAEKDQNTLVVVTADHETGGLSIIDPQGRYTNPAFHFSTGSHSAVFVPVFSYGPGADRFTGLMDNTDIFKRLMGLYK